MRLNLRHRQALDGLLAAAPHPADRHHASPRLRQIALRHSLWETAELFDASIGATGFEPATTCTPYRCATKLRYAPTVSIIGGNPPLVKRFARVLGGFRGPAPNFSRL